MTHREMPRWQRGLAAVLGIQFAVFSLLTLAAGPQPATAQETEETPAPEKTDEDPVERALEFLMSGDYDKAEAVLQTALLHETDPAVLKALWLKLIETHVTRANSFRSGGDTEIADHYYRKAKETIQECLGNPVLASLRPNPDLVPDPMPALFAETVREIFGFLVVTELVPADAIVRLGEVPVLIPPGEDLPQAENVPVGQHVITAEASGYKTATERITINPNGTYSHKVNLKKKRGIIWWAGRGAVIAGGVVAAILVGGGGGGEAAEEALPGPPGPPPN